VDDDSGTTCSMVTDEEGAIHLTYVHDVMRYRRIEVEPR